MNASASMPSRFIGCDVGKTEIVVFDNQTARTTRVSNTGQALAHFAAGIEPDALVICEATGGYEALLLDAMVTASKAVHRADARKVKAFIRSFGTLGKNDALDARALARYGAERHDRLLRWHPRDRQGDQLRLLVSTRQELVRQRVTYLNRLKAPTMAPMHPRLHRILAVLNAEIDSISAEIEALIETCEHLRKTNTVLRSIAGIGPATAAQIAASMPELGSMGRRQAASLAGLAPHPRQSGASISHARTRGGRPDVRHAIFMASLSAARHNPQLRTFYQRLRKNGKKPIVAIVAVMRKLIVIANARLRDAKLS